MRLLALIATILGLVMKVSGQAPQLSAVRYIGVGYNLVQGNPEGGLLHNGGVDPGLLPTRKILLLTYDEGRLSADRSFEVPDEVDFSPRQSCVNEKLATAYSGGKSYQKELSVGVTASASYLNSFSFTASSRYQEVQQGSESTRKVYYQQIGICNLGRARYRDELATEFSITDGFAADACRLPTSYDTNSYMNFLEDWGTHVILELDVGTKTIDRYQSSESEFVRYAMENVESSVSVGGSYAGYSGSVSVDINTFNSHMTQENKFGSEQYQFTLGGEDLHEPIHIKIIPMVDVFESEYWTSLPNFVQKNLCVDGFPLNQVKLNIEQALNGYAQWKNLALPTDPVLRIPLTWPRGTYGLPEAVVGCPRNEWNTGSRFHDTEDSDSNNQWSDPLHLRGDYGKNNIRHYFCMKPMVTEDEYNWSFSSGSYCIYKKGTCPEGFDEGKIRWDDEDSNNRNSKAGNLPDGKYDRNTDIEFCCRTDGSPAESIYLPTDKPFILLSNNERCQAVHGMSSSREYFRWDTEDSNNADDSWGSTPTIGPNQLRLTFCYYSKS